jgi:hypothetical protein
MTNAYENHGDYRMPAKAWRRRNSDYHDMWENERSAAVRGIEIEESEPPAEFTERFANPEDATEARSERQVHVWTVDEEGNDV